MDNDDAVRRHGVSPAYKNIKGFQPLQIKWGKLVIDAVFRGGKKHSNHGDTVEKSLAYLVERIRSEYSACVPIIITIDAGFYDQDIFKYCEDVLKIGYVCSGRLYDNITDSAISYLTRLYLLYQYRGNSRFDGSAYKGGMRRLS